MTDVIEQYEYYKEKAISEGATHEGPHRDPLQYRLNQGVWQFFRRYQRSWARSHNSDWFHEHCLVPLGETVEQTINHRVLKYQIPIKEDFTVELPKDIEVIRVDNQEGFMYIWGKTAGGETSEFHFKASKTGGDLGDLTDYKYIGFGAIYIQMELGLYYFMKEC